MELEALEKRAGDPAALRARLAALKSQESALLQRLAALDMAEEALGEAARERQQGFAPELAGHVERILSRVTAGKYARAAISQSLEISLQPGAGALQPWEFFSGGTVELMYLALRLGLIRMLEKHSGPLPALLDSPSCSWTTRAAARRSAFCATPRRPAARCSCSPARTERSCPAQTCSSFDP